MSAFEIAGLVLAGAAAGAVNAIAGGGTLITFPALLAIGTPPVIANATSTVALLVATAGSLYGYRRQMQAVGPFLSALVPVSVLGGGIGAVLLTWTSERTFSQLIPFLILFATILFLLQGFVTRAVIKGTKLQCSARVGLWGVLFQFWVAVYGGYFGAGIGILMLASLGYMGFKDIHQMNALKTVLASLINFIAAAWFVFAGLIDWPRAGWVCFGAFAGYYLAAHFSQSVPQMRVRQVIASIGVTLSAITFYKEFFR
jgi:uncharacterized membrane protein YfcA